MNRIMNSEICPDMELITNKYLLSSSSNAVNWIGAYRIRLWKIPEHQIRVCTIEYTDGVLPVGKRTDTLISQRVSGIKRKQKTPIHQQSITKKTGRKERSPFSTHEPENYAETFIIRCAKTLHIASKSLGDSRRPYHY